MSKKPTVKKIKDIESNDELENDDIEEFVDDNNDDVDEDEDEEEIEEEFDENDKTCDFEKNPDDEDDFFEDDVDCTEVQPDITVEYIKKEDRLSFSKLTKYEMVRILGERTKQLTMGAKPLIKNFKDLSYELIAQEEFKLNMIPYKIRRPLPNGKYEIWTLDELNKDHLLSLLD
jgi:DNA-directed RNA polymerase subunit K/omega